MSIGHFDICKVMANRNMDIRLSTLDNITNMRTTHKGKDTNVTIGVYGNVISEIMAGKLIGGLLLCNKEQYFAVKAELEEASIGEKP